MKVVRYIDRTGVGYRVYPFQTSDSNLFYTDPHYIEIAPRNGQILNSFSQPYRGTSYGVRQMISAWQKAAEITEALETNSNAEIAVDEFITGDEK